MVLGFNVEAMGEDALNKADLDKDGIKDKDEFAAMQKKIDLGVSQAVHAIDQAKAGAALSELNNAAEALKSLASDIAKLAAHARKIADGKGANLATEVPAFFADLADMLDKLSTAASELAKAGELLKDSVEIEAAKAGIAQALEGVNDFKKYIEDVKAVRAKKK